MLERKDRLCETTERLQVKILFWAPKGTVDPPTQFYRLGGLKRYEERLFLSSRGDPRKL